MFFSKIIVSALSCGLAAASALEQQVTTTSAACPYPGIQESILSCKTGSALCSTVLGRSPTTTTVSMSVYTTTVPKSTLTYEEYITKTIHEHTTLPVAYFVASTYISCVLPSSTPDPDIAAAAAAVTAAVTPAAKPATSCGLTEFPHAWIKTACACDYDSTVVIASKTKTKTAGITVQTVFTSFHATTTMTSYSTTSTITSTATHDNCYPPYNAGCFNPGNCTAGYKFYLCPRIGKVECACGTDSHGLAACFRNGACDTPCTYDYECAENHFCLYDTCCDNPSGGGFCALADICVGDVNPYTYTSSNLTPYVAKATGMPKDKLVDAENYGNMLAGPGGA